MHRLVAFDCYTHADHPMKAVRDGPCWIAFLLGPLWMIYERLWGYVTLWVAIYIAVSLVSALAVLVTDPLGRAVFTMGIAAVYLVLAIIPLLYGNRWLAARLEQRGYIWYARVLARSAPDAARQMSRDPITEHQRPV